MSANSRNVLSFADRLQKLVEDHKGDIDTLMEQAANADLDTPTLRRFVSWRRTDHVKRAEREALDEQYRFLAGERETPATLPADGELFQATMLYREQKTVRQVAEALKISVGKAQKLRTLGAAFDVHLNVNVNKPACPEMTADDLGDFLLLVCRDEDRIQGEEIAIENALGRPMIEGELGDPLLVIDKERGKFRDKVRTLAAEVEKTGLTAVVRDLAAKHPDAPIDLTIPDFLRRERASA